MIAPPERSQARDSAIDLVLPFVADFGWNDAALRYGTEGALLFPGGGPDMAEAYFDLMDRRMVERAAESLAAQRLSQRVATLIYTRLELMRGHKSAVRRAVLLLSLPANAARGTKCTARTVDTIWHAAGDRSADFSWYTKRAILAAVYATTILYWMDERTTEDAAFAFLDRRLAGVATIGKLRARLEKALSGMAGARRQDI